jgi:predicted dehydrogenase
MKRTVALAGLGSAARRIHLPAIRRIPDLEIVGGCDPAPVSGFDFPMFRTVDEMLAVTRPDLLVVITPPDSHFEIVAAGLRAGAHVVCEKPFMNSLEEADAIIELAERTGRRVVVNNQFRFMQIYQAAKSAIGTPGFGDLLFVEASQTFHTTAETEAGWRGTDPRRTCRDFGTHVLDLCRFFFNEEPLAITARMPRPGPSPGPDYLNLLQLEFSGDRVAHITLDRLSRGPHRYLDLRLDGTAGCLETHFGGGIEFGVGVRGGSRRPFIKADISMGGTATLYHGERGRKIASEPGDTFAGATRRLLQAFLAAIDTGTIPPCDASDNRRTLALMLAAYDSAEAGRRVDMTY